jgi:flagellar biosynthesis/type III secretory pathway protein FliH
MKAHIYNSYACLRDPKALAPGLNWSDKDRKDLEAALVWHKSKDLKALQVLEEHNASSRAAAHMNDGYGDGYRSGYDCGYERGFRAGARKMEMEALESSTRSELRLARGESRSSRGARYEPYA